MAGTKKPALGRASFERGKAQIRGATQAAIAPSENTVPNIGCIEYKSSLPMLLAVIALSAPTNSDTTMKIIIVHQPKIDPSFQRIAIPAGIMSQLKKAE